MLYLIWDVDLRLQEFRNSFAIVDAQNCDSASTWGYFQEMYMFHLLWFIPRGTSKTCIRVLDIVMVSTWSTSASITFRIEISTHCSISIDLRFVNTYNNAINPTLHELNTACHLPAIKPMTFTCCTILLGSANVLRFFIICQWKLHVTQQIFKISIAFFFL